MRFGVRALLRRFGFAKHRALAGESVLLNHEINAKIFGRSISLAA